MHFSATDLPVSIHAFDLLSQEFVQRAYRMLISRIMSSAALQLGGASVAGVDFFTKDQEPDELHTVIIRRRLRGISILPA